MFEKGDRVEFLPHTDIFMMGERYGEIVAVGYRRVTVRGERSGNIYNVSGSSIDSVRS